MNRQGEKVGRRGPIGFLLCVLLLLVGISFPVQATALSADRSEREPGERDRGTASVGARHRPFKDREVEPGDAASDGDFTHTGRITKEVEPSDAEEESPADRRTAHPNKRLPNVIREVPSRYNLP